MAVDLLQQIYCTTICLQFALYRKLPWKYISRLYGTVTVCEIPVWLRRPCLRLYIWLFRCRLEEAAVTDLQQYCSLAGFFRRSLRPGIRPLNPSSALVGSSFSLLNVVVIARFFTVM